MEIYEPQEDSFLLQEQVQKLASGRVLDIGTGSGIQAITASKKATSVVATDVNPEAIDYAKKKAGNIKNIKFKQSDIFNKINGIYDTIIFNPPYLPENKYEPEETALITTGGKKGYEKIQTFIESLPNHLQDNGKALIVFSSLTNKEKVDQIIEDSLFESQLLSEKKIPFETLYVYSIKKSSLLIQLQKESISEVKKLAKGHRGIVYTGNYKKSKVAIKTVNPKSEAINKLENETNWLKVLNKKDIGPKLILQRKNFFVMEYLDGKTIWEYMQNATKAQIRKITKDTLKQCRTMDLLKVNKDEMTHPVKHLIIKNDKVTLIDFERCKYSPKPQNVTQFIQFITSMQFRYGLENKGVIMNKKIHVLAKRYKKNYDNKTFDLILDEV